MSPRLSIPSSGSRAFHPKTRHGCKRCKERRVKCSMHRPTCIHCNRRNERCSYLEEHASNAPYNVPMQQALPIVEYSIDSGPQRFTHRIPISQPVLVTSLLRQIMNEIRPASAHEAMLWRTTLERSSLIDSDFLWHSLSALHLLQQGRGNAKPDVQHKALEIAYQHHIRASTAFGSMIPVITEHNWPVFLGFAISIIVCQLAMQSICPEPFFDYVEMFQVLRTSRAIDYSLRSWLMSSEMWPLIKTRTTLLESETLHDHGLQDALKRLEFAIEKGSCDSIHRGCIHVAMECLRDWVRLCESRPRRWGHYIYWPAALDSSFIDALRDGDSLALLLLLHWVAIIRLAPPRWFLETWLTRTADQILGKLPHEWEELKAWPASVMHANRSEIWSNVAYPRLEFTSNVSPTTFHTFRNLHKNNASVP